MPDPVAHGAPGLFDPLTLAKITNLQLRARMVVEGYLTGLHRAHHKGSNVEFAEYLEYLPGDDPKHVDWKVYARRDRWQQVANVLREQIAQGVLGAVRYQHLTLFRKPFRTGAGGWRYDPARVGSWVLEELVHFIDLVLWYAEADGMPCRVSAFGGDPNQPLADFQTVVLQWPGGATAVLSQCLGGFEHHTVLEVAGSQGALRTWWSGAMDRTTTPSFDMKLRHGDADAVSLEIPLSGEVFELEEHLRQAYAGFAQGRSVMSPQQARPSIVVALAVDRALREGRAIELA